MAIKKLRKKHDITASTIRRHVEEAAVMYALRGQKNVVQLIGWCNTTLIVEYMPETLESVLFDIVGRNISVKKSLEMALDAAKGVMQLHQIVQGPITHADLLTEQYLIADDGRVVLNDFNLIEYAGKNRLRPKEKCTFPVYGGNGIWRSPEEYRWDTDLTEKIDIYSLSIVLWTLRARHHPFGGMESDTIMKEVANEIELRPNVTEMADFPKAMQELIIKGWSSDPNNRPTAASLVQQLAAIISSYHE